MSDLREYIVTLDTLDDAQAFYDDMETPGGNIYIPDRVVDCVNRRPASRNTHYMLTDEEAKQLKQDPRVRDVSILPAYLGISADTCSVVQTSTYFNRSGGTNAQYINWGLLRCTEDTGRAGWGTSYANATGTIYLSATGKNVDMINVDADSQLPGHPEFAVNADGTGGSRVVYYNWYQHNPAVKGSSSTTYVNGTSTSHPIHVQGTMAGNTQGWARDAHIYNLYYYAGAVGDMTFPYVMNYVTEFHKAKPINPATGRKNPTIMNNSWGMSLFPSDWTFSDITAVTYRGTRYVAPTGTPVYSGASGVYSTSTLISNFTTSTLVNITERITSVGSTATVTSLDTATNWIGTTTTLTASVTPDLGNNDDGYWQIDLPFNVTYLNGTYSSVFPGTNSYLTFGEGSTAYSTLGATNPSIPKIMLGAGDNSVQRIYYGEEGSTGTRTFRIIVEGNASTVGVVGTPGMRYQYTFYEDTPGQIDLAIEKNNKFTAVGGGFTATQLNIWGFISGQRLPQRVSALDADLEDALAQGVITVGASGNGEWKHEAPGGPDWDNTFEMAKRYPASVANPYYYMRGSSPTASDNRTVGNYNINNIAVGAIDYVSDQKAYFSDCGAGTDIWAPGYNIMSSYVGGGVADPRNASYYLAKDSGTSMASPQVCGVIACALENNPHWNQDQAKNYILGVAKQNQLTAGTGGPTDLTDLQGSANLILHYKLERPVQGQTVPKQDNNPRPAIGQTYPRPKIVRW